MSVVNEARLSAIRGSRAHEQEPIVDVQGAEARKNFSSVVALPAAPRESCSCDFIYTRWRESRPGSCDFINTRDQCAHHALNSFTILRDGSTAARTRGGCVVALGGAGVPGCQGFAPRTALLLVSGCVQLATAACFAQGPTIRQLRQLRSIPPAAAQCTL